MKLPKNTEVVVVTALILFLCSCAGTHYKSALERNTISAYEEYIKKYPTHELTNNANSKLDTLYFRKAQRANTVDSYDAYLKRFPDGTYEANARKQIECIKFTLAFNWNSIDLLQDYLRDYPIGEYRQKVLIKLDSLTFQKSIEQNSVEGYQDYLKKYPNGAFCESAKDSIESTYYKKMVMINTIPGFQSYLEKYPSGKFKSLAMEAIESIDFNRAKDTYTSNAFQNYLKKYPSGRFEKEALDLIKDIDLASSDPIRYLKSKVDLFNDAVKRNKILRNVCSSSDFVLQKVAEYYCLNHAKAEYYKDGYLPHQKKVKYTSGFGGGGTGRSKTGGGFGFSGNGVVSGFGSGFGGTASGITAGGVKKEPDLVVVTIEHWLNDKNERSESIPLLNAIVSYNASLRKKMNGFEHRFGGGLFNKRGKGYNGLLYSKYITKQWSSVVAETTNSDM